MKFIKPQSLNGAQLKKELQTANIFVDVIEDNGAGEISFHIDKKDEIKATEIVKNHVGLEYSPSIEEKLASIGLNLNELKQALIEK